MIVRKLTWHFFFLLFLEPELGEVNRQNLLERKKSVIFHGVNEIDEIDLLERKCFFPLAIITLCILCGCEYNRLCVNIDMAATLDDSHNRGNWSSVAISGFLNNLLSAVNSDSGQNCCRYCLAEFMLNLLVRWHLWLYEDGIQELLESSGIMFCIR